MVNRATTSLGLLLAGMDPQFEFDQAWGRLVAKLKELYSGGMTLEDIGKKLGRVNKATVGRWIKGERGGEKTAAVDLLCYAKGVGLGLSDLFSVDDPDMDEFSFIPKLKARPIGGTGGLEMETEVEGFYAFRTDWLMRQGGPRNLVLHETRGDSMEPTIKSGDLLLLSQTEQDREIQSGEVYVVRMDKELMVKRVFRELGQLVLRSDNENKALFPQIVVPSDDEGIDFEIIGRVKWLARAFKNH